MSEPCRVITEEQYKDYLKVKKEKETLIEFILRHKPEMEDWIKMNFRNNKERTKNER